jgi:cell volume regulation protein A
LELSSLRDVEGDIVDYAVGENSRAAGRLVKDLALPEGVVIALVARERDIIPPQGNTRIQPGDHVVIVLRPDTRPLVNRIFAASDQPREDLPAQVEFPLRASATVGVVEEIYGVSLNAPPTLTLDQAMREQLSGEPLVVGAMVRYRQIGLRVRALDGDGRIQQVGMIILPEAVQERLPTEGKD